MLYMHCAVCCESLFGLVFMRELLRVFCSEDGPDVVPLLGALS
jgi:hypothetical protein